MTLSYVAGVPATATPRTLNVEVLPSEPGAALRAALDGADVANTATNVVDKIVNRITAPARTRIPVLRIAPSPL